MVYETLLLIRPGIRFSLDEMEQVVLGAMGTAKVEVFRDADMLVLQEGRSRIEIDYNDEIHVSEESEELAEELRIQCADCCSRFELTGNDPTNGLANVYLSIMKNLAACGRFFIIDQVEGRVLGKPLGIR